MSALGGCQARGPLALRDLRVRDGDGRGQRLERQARYRVGSDLRHSVARARRPWQYCLCRGLLQRYRLPALGLVGHSRPTRGGQGVEGRQLRRDAQGTHGDDLGRPARRGRAGTRSHRLGRPHVQAVVGETCVKDFTGHTDAVRALALLPGVGFLSASNDGTVRMWELGGTCLRTLEALELHLSIAVLPVRRAPRLATSAPPHIGCPTRSS